MITEVQTCFGPDTLKERGLIVKRAEQIVDASDWTPGTESKVVPVDGNGKVTVDM